MGNLAKHPAVLVGIGVLIGVVFASKLKTLPGVSKLPSV
jgi:hypothetical protein